MGKCDICGMNCGIGRVKTNSGACVCSICAEKCGGRTNSKIKDMSVPELKETVREYNKKALEAKNASDQELKNENTKTAESAPLNSDPPNVNIPLNKRKGCGCINVIAVLIILVIASNLWADISKERYKTMPLEKALQAIAENESMEYDGVTIDDNGVVNLYMIASDYASKDSLTYHTVNIMEKVKGRDDYSKLGIRYKMNLYDKKGNAESNLIMVVDISKDTVDSINYENFITSNLPDLADGFFVHPVLEE